MAGANAIAIAMEKKKSNGLALSLSDKMPAAAAATSAALTVSGTTSECDSCDSCASLPPSSTSSFSRPSTSCSSPSSSSSESPDLPESQDSTESCDPSGLSLSRSGSSATGSVGSYQVLPANGTETIQTVIGGLKGWFTWANYQPQIRQKQHSSLIVSRSCYSKLKTFSFNFEWEFFFSDLLIKTFLWTFIFLFLCCLFINSKLDTNETLFLVKFNANLRKLSNW